MRRGTTTLLLFIILLAIGASFVVFWPDTQTNTLKNQKPLYGITNPFIIHEGLDLQGGLSALLIPKPGQHQSHQDMLNTRDQIERRVNGGLGVSEPSIRLQNTGNQESIAVELPGYTGSQTDAVNQLLQTGKLEFWDTGPVASGGSLPDGSPFDPAQYAKTNFGTNPLFTGANLDPNSLSVGQDTSGTGTGGYVIPFKMQGPAPNNIKIPGCTQTDAAGLLGCFTAAHVDDAFTITLDRKVITSPRLQSALPGSGQITGQFTYDQANALVQTLKYGALPVALTNQGTTTVSASLGQTAIDRSLLAGGIGIGIVILYMLLYYRLPGLLADLALLLYATMTFAVFKMIGVTLSLAGIAGFILSIGMAVDANVLIFERVKEELRAGRLLSSAIDIGWKRAWPSIRDSNTSTLITCAVLYSFGSNFGATIIIGFASTLFLGVVISMFTAIVVTRTFLNLLVPTGVINHPALFGLPAGSIATASLRRRHSTV